jgi:hypothetical protein
MPSGYAKEHSLLSLASLSGYANRCLSLLLDAFGSHRMALFPSHFLMPSGYAKEHSLLSLASPLGYADQCLSLLLWFPGYTGQPSISLVDLWDTPNNLLPYFYLLMLKNAQTLRWL